MKKIYFVIIVLIFLINGANSQSILKGNYGINNAKFFNSPPVNGDYLYFSFLNQAFSENKEKRYIMNCLNEIAKFISLEIEFNSYDQTFGSFLLSDRKITATGDSAIALDVVDYVKIAGSVGSKQGDITIVKILKKDLAKVWVKYNPFEFPEFNFYIDNKILSNGAPAWFQNPPNTDGYIFGVGVYQNDSRPSYLVQKADIEARTNIIKSIKSVVNSEVRDLIINNFEMTSYYANQKSKSSLAGSYIVRRYFDEKKKIAYSLAVYKY